MQKLAEMSQLSQSLRTNLECETQQYQSTEKKEYAEHTRQTGNHFSTIQQSFQAIKDQSGAERDALLALEQELRSAMSAFNERASSWTTELTTSCSRISKESVDTSEKQVTLLDQSIAVFYSLLESICREVQTYLKEERVSLAKAYESTTKVVTEEVCRLRQQNEILARMVVDERKNSEKAKADVLLRVSGLLGDFLQERDEFLRKSVANLQRSNKEVEALLAVTSKQQSKTHEEITHRNDGMVSHLHEIGEHGLETKKTAGQVRISCRDTGLIQYVFRLVARCMKLSKLVWNRCNALPLTQHPAIHVGLIRNHRRWPKSVVMARYVVV